LRLNFNKAVHGRRKKGVDFFEPGVSKSISDAGLGGRNSPSRFGKEGFLVDVVGMGGRCNEGGGREFAPL